MKLKILAIALAIACWVYPINTLAKPNESINKNSVATLPQITVIPKDRPEVTATPQPKVGTDSGRDYSKEEVQASIIRYSEQYGVASSLSLAVAYCESGYNQYSKNKHSSASGVAQFISSTWNATDSGKAKISVFDADANVKEMVKKIAQGGIGSWNASRKCWNK